MVTISKPFGKGSLPRKSFNEALREATPRGVDQDMLPRSPLQLKGCAHREAPRIVRGFSAHWVLKTREAIADLTASPYFAMEVCGVGKLARRSLWPDPRSIAPRIIQRGIRLRTDSMSSTPELENPGTQAGDQPGADPKPLLLSPRRDFRTDDPELYEKIRRAVHKACPAWLRQRSDDLAQKAVLRVLERAKRSPDEARFCASYLYRTAYSVVIDEIRSIRRKEGNDASQGQELVDQRATASTPHSDPEFHAHDQRLGQAIRDCLAGLKQERRLALTLNLQGYSNPDAARMLDWNIKRTENLTVRGRSDLRRCLEGKGFGV